jgi:hypothetical protein
MNRTQALAPLKMGEGRFNLTAGLAIRGAVRRGAINCGVDFYEEKGWLESVFVLRGEAKRVIQFKKAVEKAFGDN